MTTLPTFPQIKPLSSKPTPAELVEFSRAVRGTLLGLQALPAQLAQMSKQLGVVAESAAAGEPVAAPTVPTEFTATGMFARIMLRWAPPGYVGHAHTEIWRAQVDDLGQAVLVDREPFLVWVDEGLPSSGLAETYYYWIRHVNRNDVAGAFNAVAGTAASTVDDPEYLLQIATEKWTAETDYAAGALAIPTRPNGYCYELTVDGGASGAVEPVWPTVIDATVADGGLTWKCKAAFSFETFFKVALVDGEPRLALKQLFLADGIIKRAMMSLLSVDDAIIDNLSVSKLLAGIITASNIFLGAEGRVHLDGQNDRLVVTDSNDVTRVVLGKLAAGYGIEIYDVAGQMILGSGGVPLSKVSGAGALAGQSAVDWVTQVSGKTWWAALTVPISAANISTYIQSAAIQTLMAGIAWITTANILDANVTTLKIGPNAVTVPVSSTTTSALSITGGSGNDGFIELSAVTIDSEGQPVNIFWSGQINRTPDTQGNYGWDDIRVTRDGTIIYETLWKESLILPDTPATGSRVYRVYGRHANDGSSTVSFRVLTGLGVKR